MKPKKWKKPKLVVLYRGQPEEAVLTICKTSFASTISGPGYSRRRCETSAGWVIQPCNAYADS